MVVLIKELWSESAMGTFKERKAKRTEQFLSTFGKKLVICSACNGTGYYDSWGSPPCGACGGKGKVVPR
jgi:DnaJ-class molecular chaperone